MKEAIKSGMKLVGVDVQKMFSHARLRLSQRRFVQLGYQPLDGYDVTRHFGDEALDPSFQYVQEGFIIARLQFIRQQLGQEEIARSTFADIGDSNGIFLKGLNKPGMSINPSEQVLNNISGLQTLQAALPYIPLPDRAFDYALCFEAVEHLQDPIGGLRELARLARKGVFISIPRVKRTKIQPYWPDRSIPQAETHVFECSDANFRTLVTYTDLRVSSMTVHRVFDTPKTLPEIMTNLAWTAKEPDVLCGVFKKFSIYFLSHHTPSNGQGCP